MNDDIKLGDNIACNGLNEDCIAEGIGRAEAIKECVNKYTEMLIDEYHLRTDLQIANIKRLEQKFLAKMAKDFIDLQPTADVVEVVRCKDCKKRYVPCYCALWHSTVNGRELFLERGDYFFCSHGERKEQ